MPRALARSMPPAPARGDRMVARGGAIPGPVYERLRD